MEGDPLAPESSLFKRRRPPARDNPKRGSLLHTVFVYAIRFLLLFGLWIVLSGRFDKFHLTLGIVACAMVAHISGELLFTTDRSQGIFRLWLRFVGYLPWLIVQIFIANLHVLYLTLHPRMGELIDPQIIEFDSRLKNDYARTTFANSITLTPGTITVNVHALGRFSVHCIDETSARSLPGEMEKKIARVFDE